MVGRTAVVYLLHVAATARRQRAAVVSSSGIFGIRFCLTAYTSLIT